MSRVSVEFESSDSVADIVSALSVISIQKITINGIDWSSNVMVEGEK